MNYLSKLIYYLIIYCRHTIKAQSKKKLMEKWFYIHLFNNERRRIKQSQHNVHDMFLYFINRNGV